MSAVSSTETRKSMNVKINWSLFSERYLEGKVMRTNYVRADGCGIYKISNVLLKLQYSNR